jgi:hypothetical protein
VDNPRSSTPCQGIVAAIENAKAIGVNGACNVPGYRTSIDVKFW